MPSRSLQSRALPRPPHADHPATPNLRAAQATLTHRTKEIR